jgi:hypothetical protein
MRVACYGMRVACYVLGVAGCGQEGHGAKGMAHSVGHRSFGNCMRIKMVAGKKVLAHGAWRIE